MRKIQKYKVIFQNGKEESKEKVGKVKSIVDSIADNLVIDSENEVKMIKERKKGVQSIFTYEDLGDSPRKSERKTTKSTSKKEVSK